MTISRTFTLAMVALMSFAATQMMAQEKKIKRSDLPAAVEKTVAAQSQGTKIRGFSEEKDQGQTNYEAELVVNGHSKDILIDGNGAIVEIEEQVAINSLPAPVKEGLQAKAGKGKLLKVEYVTKHDKLVAYEAQVMSEGKKSESRSALTENL